jgi:hypothetical protein
MIQKEKQQKKKGNVNIKNKKINKERCNKKKGEINVAQQVTK